MTEQEWQKATDMRLRQIEIRLNGIETQDAVADVHHKNVERRLGSIEGTLVWLVRSVVGGILAGLLLFILNGGVAP